MTNDQFADFYIDLGAEWIHEDKLMLNYLIDKPSEEPIVETILYQPMDVYEATGNNISQISEQDMLDYYEYYIEEYKFKKHYLEGKKNNFIYLIISGSVKSYYLSEEGNETCFWFAFENEIVTTINSF